MKIEIGSKFGRLTALRLAGKCASNLTYEWLCDCGTIKVIVASKVRTGKTKSCGCLVKETNISNKTKHGGRSKRWYGIWQGMMTRCTNQNSEFWILYGGRGITVCDRWKMHPYFMRIWENRQMG